MGHASQHTLRVEAARGTEIDELVRTTQIYAESQFFHINFGFISDIFLFGFLLL